MCTSPILLSTPHIHFRIIFEMLIVTQLVKRNSWSIMEPNSSFRQSQKPNTDLCPQQSTPSDAIFFKICFNIILPYMPWSYYQHFYALLLHALSILPSYYFLSHSSQYSHQHPILKHPQVFSCPLSHYSEKKTSPYNFFLNMVYENMAGV
jgi:hypothetical protein